VEQEVKDLGVDDTDDLQPEEELELWKLRELERIFRDRTERDKIAKDLEDVERRRKMTDAQVEEENEAMGKNRTDDKAKYRFMQKYYHKGAFYNDDEKVDDVFKRTDANAPTLEDFFDKSILPEVMQVKNFGLRGRTKYTHLTDQDTTEVNLYGNIVWSRCRMVKQRPQQHEL
jgi:microfibrillar-associated protein 1